MVANRAELSRSIVCIPHDKGIVVGWLFESEEAGRGMVEAITELAEKILKLQDGEQS